MAEYLDKSTAVDEGYLFDWYIFSLPEYNDEKLNEPRWTEEHIEELTNDFIVIPKNTPAADVAPIKHGHWILVNPPVDLIDWQECSVCGYENFYFSRFKFCPNCGAKMEDEEGET